MGKYAALLLIVGLAVGLWLGFNPTTHKDLVKFWNSTTTAQERSRPRALVNLRQLDTKIGLWLRSATTSRTGAGSRQTSDSASRQISAAWQAFWNALVRIWLDITAKFKASL
jgi:hypothetical protein